MARRALTLLVILLSLLAAPTALAEGAYAFGSEAGAALVDADGAFIVAPGEYRAITPLGGGLFAASLMNDETGLYALMDESGRALTGFVYGAAWLENGLLLYEKDGLYGAMNLQMEPLAPCEYTNLVSTEGGGFLGLRTDPYDESPDGIYAISPDGTETATGVKLSFLLSGFYEGLCAARGADGDRYGYLDATGRWAVAPQYDWCGDFDGGIASAELGGGCGVVNALGNWVVAPKYRYASAAYASLGAPIIAYSDASILLIDAATGATLAEYPTGGDSAYAYASSRGCVVLSAQDGLLRVLDYEGKERFSVRDDCLVDAWSAAGGVVCVTFGAWGEANVCLCDMKGAPVSEMYQQLSLFGELDGEAYFLCARFDTERVEYEDGEIFFDEVPGTRRMGVIDARGGTTIPAEYTSLVWLGDGLLAFEAEGESGVMTLSGEVLARLPKGE